MLINFTVKNEKGVIENEGCEVCRKRFKSGDIVAYVQFGRLFVNPTNIREKKPELVISEKHCEQGFVHRACLNFKGMR